MPIPELSAGGIRAGSACLGRREARDLRVTQAVVDEAEHSGKPFPSGTDRRFPPPGYPVCAYGNLGSAVPAQVEEAT
jgi:hypothetical protein